jgi:hypothetical protein
LYLGMMRGALHLRNWELLTSFNSWVAVGWVASSHQANFIAEEIEAQGD